MGALTRNGYHSHFWAEGAGQRRPAGGSRAAVAGVVGVLVLGACASGGAGANADTVGDCPGGRIPIVVTVDQWGDLVGRLAGACGDVTTIVSGTTGDPHDYEPTPADLAAFSDAELVVVNGLGYDAWADKALDALGHRPAVVDAGAVAGRQDGDNPHLWYDQATVRAVADAVSEELTALRPRAVEQLRADRTALESDLAPYDAEIAAIKAADGHPRYAATESVFDLDGGGASGWRTRRRPATGRRRPTGPSPARPTWPRSRTCSRAERSTC